MAILRCNKCGYIREAPNEYINKSAKCLNCQNVVKIHHTVDYRATSKSPPNPINLRFNLEKKS